VAGEAGRDRADEPIRGVEVDAVVALLGQFVQIDDDLGAPDHLVAAAAAARSQEGFADPAGDPFAEVLPLEAPRRSAGQIGGCWAGSAGRRGVTAGPAEARRG
jgi:hypothetical protein